MFKHQQQKKNPLQNLVLKQCEPVFFQRISIRKTNDFTLNKKKYSSEQVDFHTLCMIKKIFNFKRYNLLYKKPENVAL